MPKFNTPELHNPVGVMRRDLLAAHDDLQTVMFMLRDGEDPEGALSCAKANLDNVNRQYRLLADRLAETRKG